MPGAAITPAASSAATAPSFTDSCVTRNEKSTHGISATKMPAPRWAGFWVCVEVMEAISRPHRSGSSVADYISPRPALRRART